ncbi:MAG: lipid A biosynthesis acyltransferase [Bacteroidetes bacterium]|nr:lipid A biosynthesis acyltransferase [Bacteroidota bacterium]
MSNWDGKSRGNALGYRIFIYALMKFGPKAAYFILLFVALYFVFFSPKSTIASYRFLRHKMHFSIFASIWGVYKTYFYLGQSLIDKVAVLSGLAHHYSYEFDGEHHLQELVDRKEGGMLISGHLGNWDIAANFLGNLKNIERIFVVALDAEVEKIKSLLENYQGARKFEIIPVKEDGSHIFDIYNALKNNQLVCIHADRFVDGQKTASVQFFDEPVQLPIGPYKIISNLNKPYVFVYAVKETLKHYHLFSSPVQTSDRDHIKVMNAFAEDFEKKTKVYPHQWFNFYDFWKR